MNYVEYNGGTVMATGLVDLGSGREDPYPTHPALQRPSYLKFVNGAIQDAQALFLSQSQNACRPSAER